MLTPHPVLNGLKYNPYAKILHWKLIRLLVGTCRVHQCICSCMRFVLSKMAALHRLNQPRALLRAGRKNKSLLDPQPSFALVKVTYRVALNFCWFSYSIFGGFFSTRKKRFQRKKISSKNFLRKLKLYKNIAFT